MGSLWGGTVVVDSSGQRDLEGIPCAGCSGNPRLSFPRYANLLTDSYLAIGIGQFTSVLFCSKLVLA